MRTAAARAASRRTPVWVKAAVIAMLVGLPAWGLAMRHDRLANQDRLAAVASEIAGRDVKVQCPGPLRRIGPDLRGGYVRWEAGGGPSDETRLSTDTCAELDALAEGRRETQIACVARTTSCGDDVIALAWAVNTVTHEAYHLRGFLDEGVTECYSMQTMAQTAQRLGVAPGAAQNLAVTFHETSGPLKPPQYRDPGCRDGGPLDLRPDTAVFP